MRHLLNIFLLTAILASAQAASAATVLITGSNRGIGLELAEEIDTGRPYASVEDLRRRVPKLSLAHLEALGHTVPDGPPYSRAAPAAAPAASPSVSSIRRVSAPTFLRSPHCSVWSPGGASGVCIETCRLRKVCSRRRSKSRKPRQARACVLRFVEIQQVCER